MTELVRWGILGTGRIAGAFAEAINDTPGAQLQAIGSRNQSSADDFARRYQAATAHPSYEALAEDGAVDVVYIATPHTLHHANTLRCLLADKHVLCEKPMATTSAEVLEMVSVANTRRRFLMEAMWMRCFPLIRLLKSRIDQGLIGDVRMIHADFGFRSEFDASHRLFDPALGGGALLDVGIYPVAFSSLFLGEPTEVVSLQTQGDSHVDEQSAYLLRHQHGEISMLSSSIRTHTSQSAWIYGSQGRVHLPQSFWKPQEFTIHLPGRDPETISMPYSGSGYAYEVQEVMSALAAGNLESQLMPHHESVALMRTMDRIRACWLE